MRLKAKSGEERFVHRVQAAPEPMAVLALEQQLFDLERPCTGEGEFTVAGFDTTAPGKVSSLLLGLTLLYRGR